MLIALAVAPMRVRLLGNARRMERQVIEVVDQRYIGLCLAAVDEAVAVPVELRERRLGSVRRAVRVAGNKRPRRAVALRVAGDLILRAALGRRGSAEHEQAARDGDD